MPANGSHLQTKEVSLETTKLFNDLIDVFPAYGKTCTVHFSVGVEDVFNKTTFIRGIIHLPVHGNVHTAVCEYVFCPTYLS